MKSLKWSFLAGFGLTLTAVALYVWALDAMLSEPVPSWLSDSGALR